MKDKNLKKSLIKTVSFILSGFVVVVAATIGIMYLAGSFDPVVVTPTSIYFEKDLYDDIYERDEDDNVIIEDGKPKLKDSFYITVLADPDNVTVKDIELSVSDNLVISLDSTTAQIGEPIKVNITKRPGTELPYGGAATITARANGGVYGMDTCNVFIDVPVTSIEVNASITSDVVHVNQTIDLSEPTFYPSNSKNPSAVSEGTPIVAKPDKQYIYKLYFEFVQPESTTWIDVENPIYANNDAIKTAKWANDEKTKIQALRTGRFKVVAYAFDTYMEQEKLVYQETETEKLARMRVVSEKIYEVSEIDIESITATNYNTVNEQVDLVYKKTYKLYLRTNKTATELAQENGINLGIFINPDPTTGMTYAEMYNKIQDIYLTTNLTEQVAILEIGGRTVQNENGEYLLYPIMDDIWEYAPDDQKEYYYTITVIGKADPFRVTLNIVNPNDGNIITKDFAFKISEIHTDIFTFTTGTASQDGVEVVVDDDPARSTFKVSIDLDEPKTINLNNYIRNATTSGDTPTYDLIKFYALCSTTEDGFSEGLATVAEAIQLGDNREPYMITRDAYGVLIPGDDVYASGILTLLADINVPIYAVLVQTDYEGNEIIYSVTGTESYRTTYINLIVESILEEVMVTVDTLQDESSDESIKLDEGILLENAEYKVYLRPSYNSTPVDIDVLGRVLDDITVNFVDELTLKPAQVQVDSEIYLDTININNPMYCIDISIPKSSLQDFGKSLRIIVLYNEERVGYSIEYTIEDTSVKSLTLNVISNDNTVKKDFVYSANVVDSMVTWREVYYVNGEEVYGTTFDYSVSIVGKNKNYNLTSSNPSLISVITVAGRQMLDFRKTTGGGYVTITATSVEDPSISDSIRIMLRASSVIYSVTEELSATGVSVANGELYKDGVTYTKEVYYGDTENVWDMVSAHYEGHESAGLITLSLLTSTNSVIFANEAGDNGLTRAGDIRFVRNVADSETITIVLTSAFDDVLNIRFLLKNNLKIELDLTNAYNQHINSDNSSSVQNQAVISKWQENDYLTFVFRQGNTINFSNYINKETINSFNNETESNINNLYYRVDIGVDYITINESTGIISYTGYSGRPITTPTLATISIFERAMEYVYGDSGEILEQVPVEVFSISYQILLVPDMMTKYTDMEGKRTYLAGEYAIDKADFVDDVYSLTLQNADDLVVNFDGNANNDGLFAARDFAGNLIDRPSMTFEISQDVEISTYNSDAKAITIDTDKVFTTLGISVKIYYTNTVTYVFDRVIKVVPYYNLSLIDEISDENGVLNIHKNETRVLFDSLTIANDLNDTLKNTISFSQATQDAQYISINERTSKAAYITGLTYSADKTAIISVFINGEYTGYDIKVKVTQDIGEYKVNAPYNDVENPQIVNCNSEIDLRDVFTAKTYSQTGNGVDLDLTIKAFIKTTEDGVDTYTEVNYAYLENGKIKFAQVAFDTELYVQASTGLEGVEPLVAVFMLTAGQVLNTSYPIEENRLANLGFDATTLINAFNALNMGELTNEMYANLGYLEIKAGDRVDLSTYINAVNIVDKKEQNINNLLSFNILEFDYDANSWIATNKLTFDASNYNIYSTSNISVPTLVWMVISSEGGLFGIYSVYIMDSSTVNNIDNVNIAINYPTNSSNIIVTGETFECLPADVESVVDLFAIEDGVTRITATKNNRDYTEQLYLSVSVSHIGNNPGTNIDVALDNGQLTFTPKNGSIEPGTIVRINFYTSYYNSKQEFSSITYNFYFSNGYIINVLEEAGDKGYNSTLTYTTDNPYYNVADFIQVYNISDGSEADVSYDLLINSGDNLGQIVALDGNTRFQLTNMLDIDGTLLTIKVKDSNGDYIERAEYKIMLYPIPATFNNSQNEVNSISNPLIMNQGVASLQTIEIPMGESGFNVSQFESNATLEFSADYNGEYIGDVSKLLTINTSVSGDAFVFTLNRDVSEVTDITLKVTVAYSNGVSKNENFYVRIMPNYTYELVSQIDVTEETSQDSVYSFQQYDVFDTQNNAYFVLKQYTLDGYVEISINDSTVFSVKVDDVVVDNGVFTLDVDDVVVDNGIFTLDAVEQITNKRISLCINDVEVAYYNLSVMPNLNDSSFSTTATQDNPIEWNDSNIQLTEHFSLTYINSIQDGLTLDDVLDLGITIKPEVTSIIIDVVDGVYMLDASNVMTSQDLTTYIVFKVGETEIGRIYISVLKNYSFVVNSDYSKVYNGQDLDLNYLGDSFVGTDGSTIVGGTLSFELITGSNIASVKDNKFLTLVADVTTSTQLSILVKYEVGSSYYTGIAYITAEPVIAISSNTSGYIQLTEVPSPEVTTLDDAEGDNINNFYDSENKILTINGKKYNFNVYDYLSFTKYGYATNVNDLNINTSLLTIKDVIAGPGSLSNIYEVRVSYGGQYVSLMVMTETVNEDVYYYSAVSSERRTLIAGMGLDLNGIAGQFYTTSIVDGNEVRTNIDGEYSFIGVYGLPDDLSAYELNNGYLEVDTYFKDFTAYVIVKLTDVNGKEYYGSMPILVRSSVRIYTNVSDTINNIHNVYIDEVVDLDSLMHADIANFFLDSSSLSYEFEILKVYDENGSEITDHNLTINTADNTLTINRNFGDLIVLDATASYNDGSNNPPEIASLTLVLRVVGERALFVHRDDIQTKHSKDTLSLSDFGTIDGVDPANVTFKAIGSAYTLNGNVISNVYLLQSTEVSVLITIDGKYSAIGRMILEPIGTITNQSVSVDLKNDVGNYLILSANNNIKNDFSEQGIELNVDVRVTLYDDNSSILESVPQVGDDEFESTLYNYEISSNHTLSITNTTGNQETLERGYYFHVVVTYSLNNTSLVIAYDIILVPETAETQEVDIYIRKISDGTEVNSVLNITNNQPLVLYKQEPSEQTSDYYIALSERANNTISLDLKDNYLVVNEYDDRFEISVNTINVTSDVSTSFDIVVINSQFGFLGLRTVDVKIESFTYQIPDNVQLITESNDEVKVAILEGEAISKSESNSITFNDLVEEYTYTSVSEYIELEGETPQNIEHYVDKDTNSFKLFASSSPYTYVREYILNNGKTFTYKFVVQPRNDYTFKLMVGETRLDETDGEYNYELSQGGNITLSGAIEIDDSTFGEITNIDSSNTNVEINGDTLTFNQSLVTKTYSFAVAITYNNRHFVLPLNITVAGKTTESTMEDVIARAQIVDFKSEIPSSAENIVVYDLTGEINDAITNIINLGTDKQFSYFDVIYAFDLNGVQQYVMTSAQSESVEIVTDLTIEYVDTNTIYLGNTNFYVMYKNEVLLKIEVEVTVIDDDVIVYDDISSEYSLRDDTLETGGYLMLKAVIGGRTFVKFVYLDFATNLPTVEEIQMSLNDLNNGNYELDLSMFINSYGADISFSSEEEDFIIGAEGVYTLKKPYPTLNVKYDNGTTSVEVINNDYQVTFTIKIGAIEKKYTINVTSGYESLEEIDNSSTNILPEDAISHILTLNALSLAISKAQLINLVASETTEDITYNVIPFGPQYYIIDDYDNITIMDGVKEAYVILSATEAENTSYYLIRMEITDTNTKIIVSEETKTLDHTYRPFAEVDTITVGDLAYKFGIVDTIVNVSVAEIYGKVITTENGTSIENISDYKIQSIKKIIDVSIMFVTILTVTRDVENNTLTYTYYYCPVLVNGDLSNVIEDQDFDIPLWESEANVQELINIWNLRLLEGETLAAALSPKQQTTINDIVKTHFIGFLDTHTLYSFVKVDEFHYYAVYDNGSYNRFVVRLNYQIPYVNASYKLEFVESYSLSNLLADTTNGLGALYNKLSEMLDNLTVNTTSLPANISFDKSDLTFTAPKSIYGKEFKGDDAITLEIKLKNVVIFKGLFEITIQASSDLSEFSSSTNNETVGDFMVSITTYTDAWNDTYTTTKVTGGIQVDDATWIAHKVNQYAISSGNTTALSDLIDIYQFSLSGNKFTLPEQLTYTATIIKVQNFKDLSVVDYGNAISITKGNLETPYISQSVIVTIEFNVGDTSFTQDFIVNAIERSDVTLNVDSNIKENTSTDNTLIISTQSNISFNINATSVDINDFEVKVKTSAGLVDNTEVFASAIRASDLSDDYMVEVLVNGYNINFNFNNVNQATYEVAIVLKDKLGNYLEYSLIVNMGTSKQRDYVFEPGGIVEVNALESLTIQKSQLGRYYLPAEGNYTEVDLLNHPDATWMLQYEGSNLVIEPSSPRTIKANNVLVDTYEQVLVVVTLDDQVYTGYIIVLINSTYSINVNQSMLYVDPNSILNANNLITILNNGVNITNEMVYNQEQPNWNTSGIQNIDITVASIEEPEKDIRNEVSVTGGSISFGNSAAGKKYRITFAYYFNGSVVYSNACTVSVTNIFYNFEMKEDVLELYSGQSIKLSSILGAFTDVDGNLIEDYNYKFSIKYQSTDVLAVDIKDDILTINDLFNTVTETLQIKLVSNGRTYVGYMQITCRPAYSIENIKPEVSDGDLVAIEENQNVAIDFDIMNTWKGEEASLADFDISYTINGDEEHNACITKGEAGYIFTPNANMAGNSYTITFTVTAKNSNDTSSFNVTVYVNDRKLVLLRDSNEFNYSLNTETGMDIDELVKLASGATLNPADIEITYTMTEGQLIYLIIKNEESKLGGVLKVINITGNVSISITITDKINGSTITYTCTVIKSEAKITGSFTLHNSIIQGEENYSLNSIDGMSVYDLVNSVNGELKHENFIVTSDLEEGKLTYNVEKGIIYVMGITRDVDCLITIKYENDEYSENAEFSINYYCTIKNILTIKDIDRDAIGISLAYESGVNIRDLICYSDGTEIDFDKIKVTSNIGNLSYDSVTGQITLTDVNNQDVSITFTYKDTESSLVCNFYVHKVLKLKDTASTENVDLCSIFGMNVKDIVELSNGQLLPANVMVESDLESGTLTYDNTTGIIKVTGLSSDVECNITITDILTNRSIVYSCLLVVPISN